MTTALIEEQRAAVDEAAPGVRSVVYRPEAVDLSSWPKTGPWSRVRYDEETGVSVPVLRVPDLSRRAYQRLIGIGRARGLANKRQVHLAQWNQDWIGPGGQLAWKHTGMEDYAKHYADYTTTDDEGRPAGGKPRKCTENTFWRNLGVLRHQLGIVWRLNGASDGCPARYELCVRADSPLLTDLPEDLARELHLHVLARLLGEHEVPVSNEPERGAALSEVIELYGGAEIAPEQHADAAAVSRMGKYENAMIHAKTPELEALIARSALASSRGWADPSGQPAPPPLSEVPDGDVSEPVKPKAIALPGKPLPAALRTDLARLGSIKRTVLKGVELAVYGPRTKMQTDTYYREGVSLTNAFDFGFSDARVASGDGRSKAKKAPTARNINVGTGSDLATDGWPVAQEGPAEALRAALAPRRPKVDVREGKRVARRVWAMWRRERPRATWLGSWVQGTDGLATWDYGDEGWESLALLITQCLKRVPESMILSHARGAIAPNVENPLRVFAWRLHNKIMPMAPYTERCDVTRPADYVLEEEALSSAEQGRRRHARHKAGWNGVVVADSPVAEKLEAAREKNKIGSAAFAAAETIAPTQTPEEKQANAERRAKRDAALAADELWRKQKASAAAADAKLDEAVQAAADQHAAQDADRARAEAEALAEYEQNRRGPVFQGEDRQDDEHAQAHAVAKRNRKAKELADRKTPPAPAAAQEDAAGQGQTALAARIAALQARFPLAEGGTR